jgi:hypothetical protein
MTTIVLLFSQFPGQFFYFFDLPAVFVTVVPSSSPEILYCFTTQNTLFFYSVSPPGGSKAFHLYHVKVTFLIFLMKMSLVMLFFISESVLQASQGKVLTAALPLSHRLNLLH